MYTVRHIVLIWCWWSVQSPCVLCQFCVNSSKRNPAFIEMQKRFRSASTGAAEAVGHTVGLQRNCPQHFKEDPPCCYTVSWDNDNPRSSRLFSRGCNDPTQKHQLWICPVSWDDLSNLPDDCIWCITAERYRHGSSVMDCRWSCAVARHRESCISLPGPPVWGSRTNQEEESARKV